LVLGGHRLGLIVRNPRERRIQGYALLPVLQPELRNHLRRIGRGSLAAGCNRKTNDQPQQKSLPRQNDRLPTTHELPPCPSRLRREDSIETDTISH
jgi:hypothetical protein